MYYVVSYIYLFCDYHDTKLSLNDVWFHFSMLTNMKLSSFGETSWLLLKEETRIEKSVLEVWLTLTMKTIWTLLQLNFINIRELRFMGSSRVSRSGAREAYLGRSVWHGVSKGVIKWPQVACHVGCSSWGCLTLQAGWGKEAKSGRA